MKWKTNKRMPYVCWLIFKLWDSWRIWFILLNNPTYSSLQFFRIFQSLANLMLCYITLILYLRIFTRIFVHRVTTEYHNTFIYLPKYKSKTKLNTNHNYQGKFHRSTMLFENKRHQWEWNDIISIHYYFRNAKSPTNLLQQN